MRRLELDFVALPRRRSWPGILLLSGSLVAAGLLVRHYHELTLELSRLETASGLIGADRNPSRTIPKERLNEAVKNAETVVRQLTLPWSSLAQSIESAATKDVAVLQLQPDAEQRLLRLTAEARHQDAMLEYLRRLSATRALVNVHVVSHQIQHDDPERPIQFAVLASFRGAQ